MDNALRVDFKLSNELNRIRLNPCFNGKCPQRIPFSKIFCDIFIVLILVLMENALREQKIKVIIYQ